MVFERKKIQTETLGEYLVVMRQSLGLSADQVADRTNINKKFLASLESGNFKILPADVYVLGFLKQLAELYLVDPHELIEQYKKEKGIERNIQSRKENESLTWPRKVFKKLVVTPKFISLLVGLLFVLTTVFYIIWQVWSINKTPTLNIFSPHNNDVVQTAYVDVKGQTDPGIFVTINGQNVFVDSSGNFHDQIGLSEGPTDITIAAANRFGKSVTKKITLSGNTVQAENDKLLLKIDFTSNVTLGFSIDNQDQQHLSFTSGDSKSFTANQKIIVDTSDAGATKLTLNGQSLGPMGKSKESLTGVTFYPQHDLLLNLPTPSVDKNSTASSTK